MASAVYMDGRRYYPKPQAMIWADAYVSSSGFYIPNGTEYTDFIILSDHNRSEIQIGNERIENRKRMINGTMRSYVVADKKRYSVSWEFLPSRSYDSVPAFDSSGNITNPNLTMHTADSGAGGWDIKYWYENHQGPFYMLLSYDNSVTRYGNYSGYINAVHVYFSNFEYTVVKRGITDFWNISVELEEV